MHAYGTDQDVLVYENKLSKYHGDIVLVSVYAARVGNDLDDLGYELYGLPKP
jgi:hypothetical protein